jgi:hypothetical protein
MLVYVYNMRARMVDINQIRNTYMKHMTRNANKDVLSFDGVMGFSGSTSPFPIRYISLHPFVKSHFNLDLTTIKLN